MLTTSSCLSLVALQIVFFISNSTLLLIPSFIILEIVSNFSILKVVCEITINLFNLEILNLFTASFISSSCSIIDEYSPQ